MGTPHLIYYTYVCMLCMHTEMQPSPDVTGCASSVCMSLMEGEPEMGGALGWTPIDTYALCGGGEKTVSRE